MFNLKKPSNSISTFLNPNNIDFTKNMRNGFKTVRQIFSLIKLAGYRPIHL